MKKEKAIEIIKEKVDKKILFNDLQNILKNKKIINRLLSSFNILLLNSSLLILIVINVLFIHNQIIENMIPYLLLLILILPILSIIISDNKINPFIGEYLSLDTYKYLSTIIEEEELKKIALLNLTYEDLDLENYYVENNIFFRYFKRKLEVIKNRKKNKHALLLQEKEKKKKVTEIFVSSLYKK